MNKLLKRMLPVLIAVSLFANIPVGGIKLCAAQTWQDAYMSHLRHLLHSADSFMLHDIDNNGIPELIIYTPDNTLVYTFRNGQMVELESERFHYGSVAPVNRSGIIHYELYDTGYIYFLWEIEGNSLVYAEIGSRGEHGPYRLDFYNPAMLNAGRDDDVYGSARNITEAEFEQVFGGTPITKHTLTEVNIRYAFASGDSATPINDAQSWQHAYANFIRDSSNLYLEHHRAVERDAANLSWHSGFRYSFTFALHNLTGDGIPELLVFSYGPDNATGGEFQIFTFDGNHVQSLGVIYTGRAGGNYSVSNNPNFRGVFWYYARMGYSHFGYGGLANGQIIAEDGVGFDDPYLEAIDSASNFQSDNPIYNEWRQSAPLQIHDINESTIRSVIFGWQTPASAANSLNVTINGAIQNFDPSPQIIDGRTMLPLRAVSEALGMEVAYDSATRTATLTSPGLIITHIIGTDQVTVNGAITTPVPGANSVVIDGRTLVPLRMIAEATGANVEWNGDSRTVNITAN